MNFSIFQYFFALFALLSLCGLIRIAYIVWFKPRRLEKQLRRQGIKGSSYKLFNGDKKEITRSAMEAMSKSMALGHRITPRVLPFFHQMVKNHGKFCLSWFGTRPRLIIADPEIIKRVLTDKNGHFGNPPLNPLVKLLQQGVSTLEGEKWANRRKLISHAFHYEKLKFMVPEFSTSCCELINRWKELVKSKGDCEIDVASEFNVLAGDVIARTAFGSSYKEGKRIFELQKEQVILVLQAYMSIYIPGLRFMPTKINKRRYDIDKEIKATLRDMIRRKEQAMETNNSSNGHLLGLLIQCKHEGDHNNDITDEDIIEECKLLYFAGQETTANWLTWTLILLSANPDWQHKAREEVLEICGKNNVPKIEDLNHLKTVTMILQEVLRLYPPVVAQLRHTLKETSINGMSIPTGVELYLPTLLVHHDPDYWGDDVEEFRPQRFVDGVSKASKDYQMASFYPFGWGPRSCLGQNFANIEAKMALSMILQNFWFELSPSYTHAPFTTITLRPQHGAHVILHQLS